MEIHASPTAVVGSPTAARQRERRAAEWLARWSFPLQALFAMLGLFLVLLPVLLPFWHEVIQRWGFTAWVFEEFSRMGPVALGWLLFLFVGPYCALHALARYSPGGWDVARQWGFPSPVQVVERGLYPERPRERVFFWLNLALGLLGSTLWLYLPFGVLAYSLRAGG